MKTISKNRFLTAILAASLSFLSLTAAAGQDENQRYMIQQVMKAKQQAKAAEAAKAAELAKCRKLFEQNKEAKLAECPVLLEQGKVAGESK